MNRLYSVACSAFKSSQGVHVLTVIPEHKVNMPVRMDIEEPTTLLKLIERYVGEYDDMLEQLLSRL